MSKKESVAEKLARMKRETGEAGPGDAITNTDLVAQLTHEEAGEPDFAKLAEKLEARKEAEKKPSANENTVKFTHTSRKADLIARIELRELLRLAAHTYRRRLCFSRSRRLFNMLFHGIPGTAGSASALPFWTLISASCTEKYCFCFCHTLLPYHYSHSLYQQTTVWSRSQIV